MKQMKSLIRGLMPEKGLHQIAETGSGQVLKASATDKGGQAVRLAVCLQEVCR